MLIQRYVDLSVDRLLDEDFCVQKRLLAYLKKHEMDMLKFKTTASIDLPGWRKMLPDCSLMKLTDFLKIGYETSEMMQVIKMPTVKIIFTQNINGKSSPYSLESRQDGGFVREVEESHVLRDAISERLKVHFGCYDHTRITISIVLQLHMLVRHHFFFMLLSYLTCQNINLHPSFIQFNEKNAIFHMKIRFEFPFQNLQT